MSRVVHFEIHAADPDALIRFYSALFSWNFQSYGPDERYWLITTGTDGEPGINGGLMRRIGGGAESGQPVNAYVCTVGVASAKDSLDKATSLGAEVALPMMPVPGIGWLCYVKDPDGNIFGMMQSDPSAA